MKTLCAAGKNQELNCCAPIDTTSCYEDAFLSRNAAQESGHHVEAKSIFAGPNLKVDIEFKEVSFSVKVKGRGKISFCIYPLKFYSFFVMFFPRIRCFCVF